MNQLEDRLSRFGVRVTPVRVLIYNAIAQADTAYSLAELETELETVDMSSISRNLRLFLEVGLIHQIQDGSGVAKYAISQDKEGEHPQNHAHFVCLSCERITCLDDLFMEVDQLKLPGGFVTSNYSLLLKGLCPDCSKEDLPKK